MDYKSLPPDALLRTNEICRPLGPVPYSKSGWLKRVADGRAPQPVLRSPRMTVWRWSDIRTYLQDLAAGGSDAGSETEPGSEQR